MDAQSTDTSSVHHDAELTPTAVDAGLSGALPPVALNLKETDSSLMATAERDLRASLELLADRMQYLTAASAATIAVRKGPKWLCRASAGPMATRLGLPLRTDLTVLNQSINNQQIICCNNTRNATRADGASYRELGIKALMIMPLMRDSEAVGMLELLANRTDAFNDHDGETLEHLSVMVLTAIESADATERALSEIAGTQELELAVDVISPPVADNAPAKASVDDVSKVRHCESCGFPVSDGRQLCLDCEEARTQPDASGATPAFLSQLAREHRRGWLQSHFYTIGTLLMILLTVVMLLLKLR